MEGIAEAHFLGDLLDWNSRRLKTVRGVVHSQSEQELIGAGMIEAAEQPAEIRGVDVAGPGNLIQRLNLIRMIQNPPVAFLVGRKSGRSE